MDEQRRLNAKSLYRKALNLSESDPEPDVYIGLLCACKNINFINSCIDIVSKLDIKVHVDFLN